MEIMVIGFKDGEYKLELPRTGSWVEALEAASDSVVVVALKEVAGGIGVLRPDATVGGEAVVFEVRGWKAGFPVSGPALGVATADGGFKPVDVPSPANN
jgi:hypothetical protein